MEFDLIERGLRLRWLGTETLTWGDLLAIVRHLPDDSASHRAAGVVALPVQLAALTVDGVQARVWQASKDGSKGTNKPKSIYEQIVQPATKASLTREQVDDFDRWYAAKFNRHHN